MALQLLSGSGFTTVIPCYSNHEEEEEEEGVREEEEGVREEKEGGRGGEEGKERRMGRDGRGERERGHNYDSSQMLAESLTLTTSSSLLQNTQEQYNYPG